MAAPETLSALWSAGHPTRAALVVAADGRTFTYEGLQEAVADRAGRLAARGVGRGDRVALVVPDGPDFVLALLAVTALGAAAAPLNPAYTRDEYAFYLDDLAPRLLVLPEGEIQPAREGAAVEVVDLEDLERGRGAAFAPAEPDDVALLLHTSGTTSRPKQVPLLHRNLMASARTIAEGYRLTAEDVSYCAMPLFHVHGLVASTLAALAAGGTVVVPTRLNARRFWPQLRGHGVTWFSAGPTLHQIILERDDGKGTGGRLRFVRSCSSALTPALMARAEDVFGAPMLEAYGMTEASHQMASNPLPPGRRIAGSVGLPTGTEIEIVDRDGLELDEGNPGEVVIRGPGVTAGYLNNPEANADAFYDGWFRTGDRGVLEDGYLYLQGRIKEMILRGGENISPYEIEDVLKAHPLVADAIAFGIDDEKYGEVVGVAVALSGETAERELQAWCRERLAPFKVPETVFVLDAIPRTATGKVQRKRVGAELAAQRR